MKKNIFSPEARKKISDALKGNKNRLGCKITEEARRKTSESMKLLWRSLKHRKKVSESHKAEKAYNWKGDNVGYIGLHIWKKRHDGSPALCEHCGKEGKYISMSNGRKKWSIHWANKSGDYSRNLNDWIGLCPPCHGKYDSKYASN